MSSLLTHISALFQHAPERGVALLAALVLLIALILQRTWHRKHVSSNGKVILTRRFSMKVLARALALPSTAPTKKQKKYYTPRQREVLRRLYSAQEAVFGLIVFGFGLVMFIAVITDISAAPHSLFQLLPAARLLVSFLTMFTGILLVYFRNIDNPFGDV